MGGEKLKEFLDKIPIGLIAIVALAYGVFDYYQFISASDSPLAQKRAQIDQVKAENVKLQAKLKEAMDFYKTLEANKAEIRVLAQQLDGMKATLSSEIDVPAFIKMSVSEAKKVGLNVLAIKPGDPADREFYHEQPFEMTFKGVFLQLAVFLDRMANVRNIIRVDNVEMRTSGSPLARFVSLEGTIQLKTFSYRGSKADDVASHAGEPLRPPGGMPNFPAGGKAGVK